MSNNIQGKVVVITGASAGMGEAAARHLAAEGARLVLGARRADRLDALVAEIATAGGSAVARATDVSRRADVEALVQAGLDAYGRIDVLVNNAGIMPLSMFDALQVEDWDRTIDVNIKGVLYGIAAVLPLMKAQKSGQILSTTSIGAHMVVPTTGVYSATKHAVKAISEGLRQELTGHNIRVGILSPGTVKTELASSIPGDEMRDAHQDFVDQLGIPADSYAQMLAFAISQPENVDVNEILFRPTAQQM